MRPEKLEENANKFVSDVTESGIVTQTGRAFKVIISLKNIRMKRQLPCGVYKSEAESLRTTF